MCRNSLYKYFSDLILKTIVENYYLSDDCHPSVEEQLCELLHTSIKSDTWDLPERLKVFLFENSTRIKGNKWTIKFNGPPYIAFSFLRHACLLNETKSY